MMVMTLSGNGGRAFYESEILSYISKGTATFCPLCGKKLTSGIKSCKNCGAVIFSLSVYRKMSQETEEIDRQTSDRQKYVYDTALDREKRMILQKLTAYTAHQLNLQYNPTAGRQPNTLTNALL